MGRDRTISGKVHSTVAAATQQAKTVDEQRGLSKTAHDVNIFSIPFAIEPANHAAQYYAKAISSPLGQKVFSFYTTTSKQVLDIHEEARRIAVGHKSATQAGDGPATESSSAVPEPVTEKTTTV